MSEIQDGIRQMGFDDEMAHNLSEIVRITREAAIEECAQVCEGGEWTRYATHHSPTKSCALAIRALVGSPSAVDK